MGVFAIPKREEQAGKAWPAILVGCFVAFGGVLFGYGSYLSGTGQPKVHVINMMFQL